MSRFFDLVSKTARDMRGYQPSPPPRQSPAQNQAPLIRLDSNENPFGPSPRAIAAMQTTLAASNSYPDDDATGLRRKLAVFHELPTEQVLVTAGSTAMLSLLCQTLLSPGLNAVTSERSFVVYLMAVQATGAHLVEAPMREDGFDLRAIQDAINEDTRIVFLANPNNPTGTMLDATAVDKFLADVPSHVVVVLDEAYYEYASHFAAARKAEYSHSLDYVRQGASAVVLRTFSKVYGLAALRVGYGLGPAELLAYCARMRNTFSVSSIAQAAATAALDDQNHVGRTVSHNAAQSQILGVGLSELGYRVIPTWTNFLCCDAGEDASAVARQLRAEGVSVRPLGVWGAPNYVRVSIGTAEQNQFLLDAVKKISERSNVRS